MPSITSFTTHAPDRSLGRIVSVTGAKAIVMLDRDADSGRAPRPEMGTLLAIDQHNTVVLGTVSALSVPMPAQREGDREVWIAELGLAGEITKAPDGTLKRFNRGVSTYPALGDRVRLASKMELSHTFGGQHTNTARIGTLHQDPSIAAVVGVDDLLGKHFAILGTTGTGKSCSTALILRSIISSNPNAHIVLIDPHNEYATAFPEHAEVITPRNIQLPFWLLTFEELIEVLIGDATARKNEVEILQELIPICKSRYSSARANNPSAIRRAGSEALRYSVDTPVPYRMSDLTQLIDERMGRLENRKELQPYRALRFRIDSICQDPRYAFMFGSVTVVDAMAQIIGRVFRVPVNDKPISIVELTGLPTEVVSVVVSVLCRMTFDFAMWSEGKVPVLLVCEEAHRYVPSAPNTGFEPCKRAIAKIAKEGRKYGASLCVVSQRPAEIDATILSQCNTIFAMRMSNDRDQQIVLAALTDTGSGLLDFLPALGQREAIGFGDGVNLPVRITFDPLPANALPRSSSARFSERWQQAPEDGDFLEQVVERWRSSGGPHEGNPMFAGAFDSIPSTQAEPTVRAPLERNYSAPTGDGLTPAETIMDRTPVPAAPPRVAPTPAPQPARDVNASMRNLRERLIRPPQSR